MAERQPERHITEWKTQDIPSYLLTDSQGMGITDRPDGNQGRATCQAMRPAGVLCLAVTHLAVHVPDNRAKNCRCKILLLPKQGLSGIAYDGCMGLTPTRSRTRSYSLSLMPSGMSWSNGVLCRADNGHETLSLAWSGKRVTMAAAHPRNRPDSIPQMCRSGVYGVTGIRIGETVSGTKDGGGRIVISRYSAVLNPRVLDDGRGWVSRGGHSPRIRDCHRRWCKAACQCLAGEPDRHYRLSPQSVIFRHSPCRVTSSFRG